VVSVEMEDTFTGIQKVMNKSAKPIHVILADDHTLVRAGIRALLEKLPGVKVIGEAGDGREVLNLVKAQRPDVVLMDIAMPGLNGLEAAERMARDFPKVRVIMPSNRGLPATCSRRRQPPNLKPPCTGWLTGKFI